MFRICSFVVVQQNTLGHRVLSEPQWKHTVSSTDVIMWIRTVSPALLPSSHSPLTLSFIQHEGGWGGGETG